MYLVWLIFITLLKTICFLTLFLLSFLILFIIGFRLYFEPVKGVCKCQTKLNGKVALVTGGNSGIGLETARDLAERGARVIIASRDVKKSEAAVADIINTTGNPHVEHKYLDLAKFDSIKNFAEDFNKNEDKLDILVNNAGVGVAKPKLLEHNIDIIMQVNHFGPALLTDLLLDKLKASASSRIVIVSSILHFTAKLKVSDLRGEHVKLNFTRYSNSKLCNVLWARALAKRLPSNITVNSLHPGTVKTDIFNRMHGSTIVLKIIDLMFKSTKEGAQTSIHLCVAPELETGGYFQECRRINASKNASNDDLADKVWNETWKILKGQ